MEIVLQARLRDRYMSIFTWKSCCRIGCDINIRVFTHGNRVHVYVARKKMTVYSWKWCSSTGYEINV